MKDGLVTMLLAALLFVLAGALLLYHAKTRKAMNLLNKMLDEAIGGSFEPSHYSEAELSKIEAKLSRFLNESKLKKGQMEEERRKIHALIGDISHQTKTPIANAMLYAQLLNEQACLSAQAKALAGQIVAGTEKLNFLIQALIKTSRLETGVISILPCKNNVGKLLDEVCDACRPKAKRKGVLLSFKAAQQPVHAMLDPKWCAEAFFNIIENAIKYTDTGGQVKIGVQQYELFVRVDVCDTGSGICEQDLPRVFSRFWRAANLGEREGVGIGLYLAREIVLACGGYIKVSSALGKGSVFSVFLPKA